MLKSIVNMNPSQDFRAFDEMFERLMGVPHRTGPTHPATGVLPVDVLERDGALIVKAAVPGVEPENVEVNIEENVLTIRGELKSDYEESKDKVYRREYSYGQFSRSVRLPDNLNLAEVKATFKNGFVTITLPRNEEATPKSLRIPVQTGEDIPTK